MNIKFEELTPLEYKKMVIFYTCQTGGHIVNDIIGKNPLYRQLWHETWKWVKFNNFSLATLP